MGQPASERDSLDVALEALASGRQRDPFAVLGPHRVDADGAVVVRAFQPAALAIELKNIDTGAATPMARRPDGVFEIRLPGEHVPDYRFRVAFPHGHIVDIDDPYRYGRVLSDFDLHLLGEGTHYRAYERLGAHRMRIGPATGVHFAVWAPNAERV